MRFKTRMVCLVSAFVMGAFGFAGCGDKTPPPDGDKTPPINPNKVEILGDNKFSTGIHLLGTDPGTDGRTTYRKLDFGGTAKVTERPVWEMAQWCSSYDLSDELDSGRSVEKKSGDTYIYEDPAKTFKINPKTGQVDLIYRASVDYADGPRDPNSNKWSHMLLEQNFANPPLIGDVSEVRVAMDLTFNQIEKKMTDEDYIYDAHAAQLVWFITLTNQSSKYGTKGDYIWFGVPLYDDRGLAREDTVMYDKGTAHYMYGIAANKYYDNEEHIEYSDARHDYIYLNKPLKFDYNILPLFKSAFNSVQASGGMKGARFEDMAVTYMNMGWEIPGTFDVDVTIRNMDIYGIKKTV